MGKSVVLVGIICTLCYITLPFVLLQLEVFRGQCKPTWLFMSGGEPVAVMHGANAPLLQKMIEKEIRRERQVLKGEACRETINLEDAVPG